ncbi:MAG: ATP-binding protein [Calditerrivibrio sp.]|nr:ATP-binding protein [Calditerrivibrio sp.]
MILLQIGMSVVISLVSIDVVKKNSRTLVELVSVIFSSHEREVTAKLDSFNILFNRIERLIVEKKIYSTEQLLNQLNIIELPKNFDVGLVSHNGVIFETTNKAEAGVDLFRFENAKLRLLEARETGLKYLDFPVYNTQNNRYYAYILKYLPYERIYLQVGFQIDVLNDFRTRLHNILDKLADYDFKISIYHVSTLNNITSHGITFGEPKKEDEEVIYSLVKNQKDTYEDVKLFNIKIGKLLLNKIHDSYFGIFYVVDIKPRLWKYIIYLILANLFFSLIYVFMYISYKKNIQKVIVQPITTLADAIEKSIPLPQLNTDLKEIKILHSSFLKHLENINLRDFFKEILMAQEKEREKIAKDIHDTVLQDLNYILIQLIKNKMGELALVLREDIKSLRTLVIENDINQMKISGLKGFLENLKEDIEVKYSDFKVEYEYDVESLKLDIIEQLIIARIIKELVQNAVKHSCGNFVRITMKQTNDEKIMIVIKDNGKGFDYEKEMNKKDHLGLKTVKERVYMLNGEINVDSLGFGTKVEITIPNISKE